MMKLLLRSICYLTMLGATVLVYYTLLDQSGLWSAPWADVTFAGQSLQGSLFLWVVWIVALSHLLFGFERSIASTVRCITQLPCWLDRERVNHLVSNLDSVFQGIRRRALQTFADYVGHPLGPVDCWPWCKYSPAQFEALVALHRGWWNLIRPRGNQAFQATPSFYQAVVEELVSSEKQALGRRKTADDSESPRFLGYKLTTLPRTSYLNALRNEVDRTLLRCADIIDGQQPGQDIASCQEAVSVTLSSLSWRVVTTGLEMRMGRESPDRASEESRVECPTDPPENSILAVTGPPAPAGILGVVDYVRTTVDDTLDEMTEAVKDVLLELGSADAVEKNGEPLPALSPERLHEATRERIAETMRLVAEALNETDTAHVPEVINERIQILFTNLWHETVQRGQEMRTTAAEARLPEPQAPESEWARKYRHMRAGDGYAPYGSSS